MKQNKKTRSALVTISVIFVVVAATVALVRHESVVNHKAQATNNGSASSVLSQIFGIESTKPLIVKVPAKDARAHIGHVDLSTNIASGQYKDEDSVRSVKLDINTVLPLGMEEEHVYSAIVILPNGNQGNSYYLCSFRYDSDSEFMELIDSELLGHGINITAIEATGDLIHLEVVGGQVPSNTKSHAHSFLVTVSDQYQLDTLKIRPHD